MTQQSRVKARIQSGETVVALRVALTVDRRDLEAALSTGSYDYVYVDGQHRPFSEQQIVDLSCAAEELGYQVQFRIPHTRHAYLVGRFLDLGLSGILVPEVMDPSTAQEAVDFSYYPPFGKRSWGGEARFGIKAMGDQFNRLSYAEWWNHNVIVAMQIESVEAVINARGLALPGVDYLAFGPNDLQFSLEAHPEFPLRSVEECVQHVLDQLKDTDVQVGIATTVPSEARTRYEAMGVTLFQESASS